MLVDLSTQELYILKECARKEAQEKLRLVRNSGTAVSSQTTVDRINAYKRAEEFRDRCMELYNKARNLDSLGTPHFQVDEEAHPIEEEDDELFRVD
jgi:hypothetical protein